MTIYLIDNSVLHGLANTKDLHHTVCKNFFKEHQNDELYFPIHSLFEFQASRARRIKGNDFEGLPGVYTLKNKKFVDINRKLYDDCEKQKLFEKFKELKGSDLLYACIAHIGKCTLVTCDSDFDIYKNDITIMKLS